jgi:hypothetical protein
MSLGNWLWPSSRQQLFGAASSRSPKNLLTFIKITVSDEASYTKGGTKQPTGCVTRRPSEMFEKELSRQIVSRRNMFSLVGLAVLTGVMVASTVATAQTSGMERRDDRRDQREQRRDERRGTTDKPAQTQPAQTQPAQTQSPPKQ